MLTFNFKPFPVIETERLLLRKITRKDADDIYIFRQKAEVMKYIGKPTAKSVSEIKELIKKIEDGIKTNSKIVWGITLKNENKVIGTIGYHRMEMEHHRAEIGYMINQPYWNKGMANEAMKVIIDYGFIKMNLHSIEAKLDPVNIASKKLLTKFGFVKEAYFKENYFFDGKFQDTEVCSLIRK